MKTISLSIFNDAVRSQNSPFNILSTPASEHKDFGGEGFSIELIHIIWFFLNCNLSLTSNTGHEQIDGLRWNSFLMIITLCLSP